jgi:hypothetical protein
MSREERRTDTVLRPTNAKKEFALAKVSHSGMREDRETAWETVMGRVDRSASTLSTAWIAFIPAACIGLIAMSPRSVRAEPQEKTAAAQILFNRDIRPILSDNCFSCHGPDANNRKADLRLDLRDKAIAAGAIAPGKAAGSSLIERIHSTDTDEVMPPPDSHKKLDAKQKKLLARWIDQGAEYQKHWAYEPPTKPVVPPGANGVDHVVRQRLATLGLSPSPEADRRTLIRRLSFDLRGLPPTPDEVDAFTNDPSPDAYDKLVERLLSSPHYGERMAIGWLDVVRFADTIGYHSDRPRNVWPYRDWVIRSFNENKPFDRFTIEQIAGDLLPDANQDTRIASCFNRLLLTTEEGGAQPKDYEARMLTDRVRAVGTVWLGQTIGCAQCHDHKFDPITMRDFYSLGAFFADVQEGIVGAREDGMVVGTPDEHKRLAETDAALAAAKKTFDSIVPQLDAAQQQWETDFVGSGATLPELAKDAKPSSQDKNLASQAANAFKKDADKRTDGDKKAIKDYFRAKATSVFVAERDALNKADADRNEYYASLTKCLVTARGNPRIVRSLPRGNWMDESGEVMKPALPAYLPPPTVEGRDLTRLDLAQWLVSGDNPLTARVTVNRLWKQFFGTGLSRVVDDLGGQGEPPTNPELLDWLACEFIDSKWDVKHVVRTIVRSATYRQASVTPAQLVATDPLNRELARQTPLRLEAEVVRDVALAASGLLVRTVGGPSVKPYQPDGYWENLSWPNRTWEADSGSSQYRRGLYTWWQRSFLHPSMLAFDAPSREECCADRTRSNIPQQALVLLNDPTYVEASRALAIRILKECSGTPEERVNWAWRQVLQRAPDVDEMELVMPLFRRQLEAYKVGSAAADEFLKFGLTPFPIDLDKAELAAWTHVARILLNLHETITRS